MKKLMICTALATCIGTFPIAADADKLVANSDTGVNVRAMEDHLGIDRDQKHVVGYVLTENETVVETTTEARGGILANSELTEAEKNAAADADVKAEAKIGASLN